jgi:hypothetical protein
LTEVVPFGTTKEYEKKPELNVGLRVPALLDRADKLALEEYASTSMSAFKKTKISSGSPVRIPREALSDER